MTGPARPRFFREGHAWYGLQLAAAILLAWAVSAGLGLPESLWAVMSVLVVSRADAGATLGAGWRRLGATLGGALVGLAGAAVAQAQLLPAPWLTLALTTAVVVATADRAGLRGAAITTLIVISAVDRTEVSPLTVAGLRTLEIAVGAWAAMACAWLAHRTAATARPASAVASLLRDLAAQIAAAAQGDAAQREARSAAARAALRRLGEMLDGVPPAAPRRGLLLLAMRLAQDAGWMARQVPAAAQADAGQTRLAADAACTALRAVAGHIESGGQGPAAALAALGAQAGAPWRPDALLLLQEDLRKLLDLAAVERAPRS